MNRLDEIKARRNATTEGNWITPGRTGVLGAGIVSAPAGLVIAMAVTTDADADFIANAPADIDWLLAEIERLRVQAS